MTTLTAPAPEAAQTNPALLEFFKALSDVGRLQVAGRLAGRDLSAAQLGEALGQPPAAIRKHLDGLIHAELVDGPHGAGQTYRWRRDYVQTLAAQALPRAAAAAPPSEDEFAAKVLRDFLTPEGAIRELPAQEKKYLVVARYALQAAFEVGPRYTEKEVNERLKRLHADTATLRRTFVDRKWMEREKAGGSYWRVAS